MTIVESEMEIEARKRKERLAALKRKVTSGGDDVSGEAAGVTDKKSTEPDTEEATTSEEPGEKKPASFRSYKPMNEDLVEDEDALKTAKPEKMESLIEEHLADTQETTVIDEVDLTTLAPRKIDWDLKRDIAKKLEKLDRRTQRAMAELIRERLASGKEDLLASAVNSSSAASQHAHLSDDDDDD